MNIVEGKAGKGEPRVENDFMFRHSALFHGTFLFVSFHFVLCVSEGESGFTRR